MRFLLYGGRLKVEVVEIGDEKVEWLKWEGCFIL